MLQEMFHTLLRTTSDDETLYKTLWQELASAYNQPSRYYHTLTHLETLVKELATCKVFIKDYDTVLYAVFYHDVVYDVLLGDNEERSAAVAINSLTLLGADPLQINKCAQQILATKKHDLDPDNDTNLFTDADLAILGTDRDAYDQYREQIRQEYGVYKDEIYFPGRLNVLQHFLNMDHIYKTHFFRDRYEEQARTNILREMTEINRLL